MGKGSGTVIALIALFISLGLGGYIVYDKVIASPETNNPITPTSNQYFKTNYGYTYVPTVDTWFTIPELFIEFNITQGESVCFFYLGQTHLVEAAGDTYLEFRLVINGIRMNNPKCRIGRYSTVTPGGLVVDASLQHFNSTMIPGTHNVTIAFRGGYTTNYIYPQSLLVQTFK